ncbi:recQ-mediated genome instability protein 1 [Trichonephila clavipes]|nr:recQ-mediated genome instability protein 1 [Trichonephila clavipes]
MTTSQEEISNVKNFLEQQFISISLEWVEACISFINGEHNQTLSLQGLKNLVYQQWLDADLEEIGVSSLPLQMTTTQKMTLNGCFALQVDGIRDVGRPAYVQLKELDQKENSNGEFSAAPEQSLPPWESKPTRMLMLNLTDGCTQIQGMEYKPINTLSPNLPPGTKVLIQGPIDCRLGVLLLTSERIRILGGEVENKLIKFSRKAILREALQLPPEDDAETDHIDAPANSETLVTEENQLNPSAYAPENHVTSQQFNTNPSRFMQSNAASSQNQRIETRIENNVYHNHFDERNPTAGSSRQQNIFMSRNRNNADINNMGNIDNLEAFEEEDDFEQTLDYGALDELERENLYQSEDVEIIHEEPDIWDVDEDVMQDMMAFQDENPGFQIPSFHEFSENKNASKVDKSKPFTYLYSALKNPLSNCTVTIKGFIITVLSKLECTVDKGWSLMVKINDGTASLDVNIHDKVLEGIIGISAPAMVKMQLQAATNPDKRKEVMEAISKCKVTLQEYNCLMDVKFSAGSKPCLVKAYPINELHVQQLCRRVELNS